MRHGYMKYLVPAIVILAGIIAGVSGFYMGASKDYKDSLSITDMEAAMAPAGVKNLDIEVDAAEFVVMASNDVSDFTIKAENISKKNLDYSVSNGTFKFRYGVKKWYNYADMIGLLKSKGKIVLLVPADTELLDVQIVTGFLPSEISYLTAERIYVECGYGKSDITNLTADHVEITGGSSKTECHNLTGKTSNLSCGTGRLCVKNINVDDLGISCRSGDIAISGIINGDSIVSCGSGSISMDIYKSSRDFKFVTEGNDIRIDGSEKIPENKDAESTIDVVCGLGKVDMNFNK
ncbi:MAG: DUF4097 family beta strand repeat-containing protein [Porcipelethomonas sp.]